VQGSRLNKDRETIIAKLEKGFHVNRCPETKSAWSSLDKERRDTAFREKILIRQARGGANVM
jgi:hypothetical protein